MLAFAAILMAWEEPDTQFGRFKAARATLSEMFPTRLRVGKTYQGFISALLKINWRLLDVVIVHLRAVLQQVAGTFWKREGLLAFAVDGSRVECPRTKANEEALGHAGKKGCGPQMWLTTLWHMGTGLPWCWRIGRSDECERNHLRGMLGVLPTGALLVGDAGFVGYELLSEILSGGRSFLVRVGSNVRLLKELGWVKTYGQDTVHLWPVKYRSCEPLTLRLIAMQRRGKNIYLITNIDEGQLPLCQASVLYGMRWGVEVFYRSLKQTLKHRTMRSRAPEQARAELAWSLVGLHLLGLMSVREIISKGIDPLRWSAAATLTLVRQACHERHRRCLGAKGWKTRLAQCVRDAYNRQSSKDSRDWPDRKRQQPPGPPKINLASAEEVQQAQALRDKLIAA